MERTLRRPPRVPLVATATAGVALAACGETPSDTRRATAGLPHLEQSVTAHEWLPDAADSTIEAAGAHSGTLASPVRTADVTDRDRLVLTSDGVPLSFTAVDAREPVVRN